MPCKNFPHGITVHNKMLFYTSYETSGLYIHSLLNIELRPYITQKWQLTHYYEPIVKDMVVMIPFFNPLQSTRLLQNFLTVRETLECAGIPYQIGELAMLLFHWPRRRRYNNIGLYRSASYGFYKEAILNSLIRASSFEKYTVMNGISCLKALVGMILFPKH